MSRVLVIDTLNVTLFDSGESVLISGTDRDVEVETIGTRVLIRGRKFAAVQAEVDEYRERGCRLDGEIEYLDGYYIAACVDTSMGPTWVQRPLW